MSEASDLRWIDPRDELIHVVLETKLQYGPSYRTRCGWVVPWRDIWHAKEGSHQDLEMCGVCMAGIGLSPET